MIWEPYLNRTVEIMLKNGKAIKGQLFAVTEATIILDIQLESGINLHYQILKSEIAGIGEFK